MARLAGMDTDDRPTEEERIAWLIAALPPAPAHLVTAAQELPATLRALEEIDARLLDGATGRALQTAELEGALRDAGVDPTAERVAALERQVASTRQLMDEGRSPRP